MDKPGLEEPEGWVEVVQPEKEVQLLEDKLKEKSANAEILKKDVQNYLQETLNVLQAYDLSKLQTQQLESKFQILTQELNDTRQKLSTSQNEKEKIANIFSNHIDNHGDTISDLQVIKDEMKLKVAENIELKNQTIRAAEEIEKLNKKLTHLKKMRVKYQKLTYSYEKFCKKILLELRAQNVTNAKLNAELQELKDRANALEAITQKNQVKMTTLQRENNNQKRMIAHLNRSAMGLFSVRKINVQPHDKRLTNRL
jgi:chromosome segregation ATPase